MATDFEAIGRAANRNGDLAAPSLNAEVRAALRGLPVGSPEGAAIMQAFSHGWHEANLASEGFYVSVVDGTRFGMLLGPYDTHEEALANVERVRCWATERDHRAHWYGFGTSKVAAKTLKPGRLNEHLPLHEEVPTGV